MWASSKTHRLSVEKPLDVWVQRQRVFRSRAFSHERQPDKPDQTIRWTEHEDRVLIARGLSGDRQALDELFTRYARIGYRNALAILGSPEDAEDALQDGLFSAFRNLRRFEGRAGFSTWLTRIVINAALMKLRTRRFYQTVPLTDQSGEHGQSVIDVLHDPHPTPEAELSGRQVCGIITDAVCELPQRQKRVLLHYSSGWPARNIAESLGISVGCVKSTLHRARLKVAMRLTAQTSPAELAGRVRSRFAVQTGYQEDSGC